MAIKGCAHCRLKTFKQTKSHKRDKCIKILLIIAKNTLFCMTVDSLQICGLKERKILFCSVSLLSRLLKSPHLSHNLNKYSQKNLSFSLTLFTFIFHSIDPASETSDLCAPVLLRQRTANDVYFHLQLASHVLSWFVIDPMLFLLELGVSLSVCTGCPHVFHSGYLSICSSSFWTSRIIGETERY